MNVALIADTKEFKMKVIDYFESDGKEHWISEIKRSDWRAGAFLARLLENGTFYDAVGEGSRVLLLTDGEKLVSYCTYAKKDDIQPTELSPWVGFVYTFPEHRGQRRAGLLFEEVERLAGSEGVEAVYLSTNHVGLYEKYGFEYLTQMTDVDGMPTGVYVKRFVRRTR
jgi:GNAT superfamily N-acetyltransferase